MFHSPRFSALRTHKGWLLSAATAMALMTGGAAQAADVYWSIGVHQPGVHVGVSNAPQVVVAPPPVVVYAPPVYRTGWTPPGHGKHLHKHHARYRHGRDGWGDDRRGHDRWDGRDDHRDDRRERWDDRRDHRR